MATFAGTTFLFSADLKILWPLVFFLLLSAAFVMSLYLLLAVVFCFFVFVFFLFLQSFAPCIRFVGCWVYVLYAFSGEIGRML